MEYGVGLGIQRLLGHSTGRFRIDGKNPCCAPNFAHFDNPLVIGASPVGVCHMPLNMDSLFARTIAARLLAAAGALVSACTEQPVASPQQWPDPDGGRPTASTSAPAIASSRRDAADRSWAEARRRMVDEQIRRRGIESPTVLAAMARVPRHLFVPQAIQSLAYTDSPLSIGEGQTISQPYIVAYMTAALNVSREDTVLEIGTGSGYQAAVLAELVRQVLSIEIVPQLADRARRALAAAGYANVEVRTGDGYRGWPERAPFSRIIVTAAPPEIPSALVDQLAVGGRMVLPVGTDLQEIVLVTKSSTGVTTERTIPVRFVPMVKGRP